MDIKFDKKAKVVLKDTYPHYEQVIEGKFIDEDEDGYMFLIGENSGLQFTVEDIDSIEYLEN